MITSTNVYPENNSQGIQLTPAWYPLRYHETQARLWDCAVNRRRKFIAAVAGRGSGKTELARRFIVLNCAYKKQHEALYAYCLPTFAQAKKVAWYPILSLFPKEWIKQPNGINKSESSITTIFNSTLYVVGMDKPHRIEGLQLDGCVMDESSDQRPGAFSKTIVPMLTHRNGWCWRIGVPKRSGIGRVDYRSFFQAGLDPNHPTQASFQWRSAGVLTQAQLDEAREQLDPQEFAEQFEAEWVDAGGTVYFNYSSETINDTVVYNPTQRVYVGCDFNVDPMAWVLCHLDGDGNGNAMTSRLRVFDEIFLRNTNTQKSLDFLHQKYGTHEAGWTFIGDASGRARKTSATRSDYLIVKNDTRFSDKRVLFPNRNPQIRDRIACVNAALCNAKGERRLLISPRCKHLLNDLMIISYKEGTSDIENYDGTDIGHIADGLGYVVHRMMPIKLNKLFSPSVVTSNP